MLTDVAGNGLLEVGNEWNTPRLRRYRGRVEKKLTAPSIACVTSFSLAAGVGPTRDRLSVTASCTPARAPAPRP